MSGSFRTLRSGLVIILTLIPGISFTQVNVITDRIRNDLISQNVSDTEISNLLASLKQDGSWDDIDYANAHRTNWDPSNHSRRLFQICRAYNKPSSIHFHKSEVKSKILSIIDFYITRKPVSDNWWYNAIGAPTNLGPALVLMKTGDEFAIDQAQLEAYADALLNYYTESAKKWPGATTGANKIWLLSSSIDKSCIKNNEEVLRENFRLAFEEAEIMPGTKEGIKIDNSFYQHRTQLYIGGYGMSFMSDISYFAVLAAGTDYRMSDAQMKVITDILVDGYRWFIQHSAFDFGSYGREISRPGAGSSQRLVSLINRFISINAPRSRELSQFIDFINGKAPFLNPGNRHFWKSDIMVHHGSDFYLSARVPSKRTMGSETMNDENLRKKWLPWGATNIMIDGDEYRNIYATWDWSRIPGVTSVLEDIPGGKPFIGGAYIVSTSDFAGGVSDGTYGFAAYDYSWDNVSGRKAWFFTPEAMYCLGAGIKTSGENPVITTVNQCFSSGEVTVLNNKKTSLVDGNTVTSPGIKWIHHDRIGYLFPSGGEITVKNMDQTGTWYDINLSQSKAPVTNKVFSAWIDHGKNPIDARYEYIVVPFKDLSEFSRWQKKNPLKKVLNSTDIQAVYDKKGNIYGIAFYKAGSVTLREGLNVETDKPCLLLIQAVSNGGYIISVSDPTELLKEVNIKISGILHGQEAANNSDGTTSINFVLPSGDEAGKSVTRDFSTIIFTAR
jgi:chondroitin AC lyase